MSFWNERMQGGMDSVICGKFAEFTQAAARSELDHWAASPRGRLALVVVLDQFPRSLWRATPAAYAQDIKACVLAMEALQNGHYDALPHFWERQFHITAISHCEGPDHLARMKIAVRLTRGHLDSCPEEFRPMIEEAVAQAERVQGIIERFGRHPHRNAVLGRLSSDAEQAYIDEGDFPHLQRASTEGERG